jgi:hypothetical protein
MALPAASLSKMERHPSGCFTDEASAPSGADSPFRVQTSPSIHRSDVATGLAPDMKFFI